MWASSTGHTPGRHSPDTDDKDVYKTVHVFAFGFLVTSLVSFLLLYFFTDQL